MKTVTMKTPEEITKEDFSEFLVNMRESLGMSQSQFGKAIGINQCVISSWERQKAMPMNVLKKVSKIREFVKSELMNRRIGAR